jgi:hypothetical protein
VAIAHEANNQGGGKYVHVVFTYLPIVQKPALERDGRSKPSHLHHHFTVQYFPADTQIFHFKNDKTVRFHGVSFLLLLYHPEKAA